MKILFLANKVPWPLKDGGAIGTFSISYGLAKAGCHVDMLAINTKKHHINPTEIPEDIRQAMQIETVQINTDISPVKMLGNLLFSRKAYIASRFYHQDFENKLIAKLKSTDYDVVILEMLYLASYIPCIREHSKAHITMRAPNIEHEIWSQIAKNEHNTLKRIYLRNLAKRIKRLEYSVMNQYDSLIPVSDVNGETYKNMGVTVPIVMTTTGVFLDKLPHNKAVQEENALSHIGALDWMPNLEGLSWFIDEVWPLILEKRPNTSFYIAGRNAPANAEEKLNGKNIKYLGEVPDAYDFIQSKSILIVPLLSGSGMRVKIIEGLALGRSIVSTKTGAEGIDLVHNKHLKIVQNKEEFANSCIELLDNPEEREKLSKNGEAFVRENYDNLQIAENLVSFYKTQLK